MKEIIRSILEQKKYKLAIIILIVLALLGYLVIGNPLILNNNQKLGKAIKVLDADRVKINEVIPFEWDTMYTFDPYSSKESIEEIIGFKSRNIKVNNISEGMVHLLIVKDNKVVASVLGHGAKLGYSIDFPSPITLDKNASFNVTEEDGIINLRYTK